MQTAEPEDLKTYSFKREFTKTKSFGKFGDWIDPSVCSPNKPIDPGFDIVNDQDSLPLNLTSSFEQARDRDDDGDDDDGNDLDKFATSALSRAVARRLGVAGGHAEDLIRKVADFSPKDAIHRAFRDSESAEHDMNYDSIMSAVADAVVAKFFRTPGSMVGTTSNDMHNSDASVDENDVEGQGSGAEASMTYRSRFPRISGANSPMEWFPERRADTELGRYLDVSEVFSREDVPVTEDWDAASQTSVDDMSSYEEPLDDADEIDGVAALRATGDVVPMSTVTDANLTEAEAALVCEPVVSRDSDDLVRSPATGEGSVSSTREVEEQSADKLPIMRADGEFEHEPLSVRSASPSDPPSPIELTSEDAGIVEAELTTAHSEEPIQADHDEVIEDEAPKTKRTRSKGKSKGKGKGKAKGDGTGKPSEARTVPPRYPHIIPLEPWLVDFAVRLVKKLGKPCFQCAYTTLDRLFEVAEGAPEILLGTACAPCSRHRESFLEGERVNQKLPAERVTHISEDLRKVAIECGAMVLGETGSPPFEKPSGSGKSIVEMATDRINTHNKAASSASRITAGKDTLPTPGTSTAGTTNEQDPHDNQLLSWVQARNEAATYCRPPWCPWCWRFFETPEESRDHFNTYHETAEGESGWLCPFEVEGCRRVFGALGNLRKHVMEIHMGTSIKCPCGKMTKGNSSFNRHQRKSKNPKCHAWEDIKPGWSTLTPAEIAENVLAMEAQIKKEHFQPPPPEEKGTQADNEDTEDINIEDTPPKTAPKVKAQADKKATPPKMAPQTKARARKTVKPSAPVAPVAGPSKRKRSDEDEDEDYVPKKPAGPRRSKRVRT